MKTNRQIMERNDEVTGLLTEFFTNQRVTRGEGEAAMMTLLGVSFGDAANDEMELWGRIQRSQRFIEDVARATFAAVLAQAAARSKP